MKAKVALIPGILREEMAADSLGTLKQVAEIGYQGVEGGRYLSGDAEQVRKGMDSIGLKTVAIGGNREALTNGLDGLIGDAKALGAENIVLYWAPCKTKEEVLKDAELFESAGARIAAAGLRFCYHNHDQEFKNVFGGQLALDLLMENTSPNRVFLELDAGWVLYGGGNPVEYIRKYSGRIPLIHLKDVADLKVRGAFTAVGTGLLDVKGVVEAALANRVEWVVVEQDRPNRLTPMESVLASYLNLKELGLV